MLAIGILGDNFITFGPNFEIPPLTSETKQPLQIIHVLVTREAMKLIKCTHL